VNPLFVTLRVTRWSGVLMSAQLTCQSVKFVDFQFGGVTSVPQSNWYPETATCFVRSRPLRVHWNLLENDFKSYRRVLEGLVKCGSEAWTWGDKTRQDKTRIKKAEMIILHRNLWNTGETEKLVERTVEDGWRKATCKPTGRRIIGRPRGRWKEDLRPVQT